MKEWAAYVVTKCAVNDGVFWASTLEVAKSIVRRFGGRIQKIVK